MAVMWPKRAEFGDEFVDRVNRWRAQEQCKGRFVRQWMNTHYADAMLLAPTTWLGSYFLYKSWRDRASHSAGDGWEMYQGKLSTKSGGAPSYLRGVYSPRFICFEKTDVAKMTWSCTFPLLMKHWHWGIPAKRDLMAYRPYP
jgi:hypothetical protein